MLYFFSLLNSKASSGEILQGCAELDLNTLRVLYLMATSAFDVIGKPPSESPRKAASDWGLLFLFSALCASIGTIGGSYSYLFSYYDPVWVFCETH